MANRIKGITVEIGGDTTKLVGGRWTGVLRCFLIDFFFLLCYNAIIGNKQTGSSLYGRLLCF